MKKLSIFGIISLVLFITIGLIVSFSSWNADWVVNSFFSSFRTDCLTSLAQWIDVLFDTKMMVLWSLILSAILWIRRSRKDSLFFISVMALDAALLFIIKIIVARPRPFNSLIFANDYAFPSGHTTSAVVFFSLLAYLLLKKQKSTFVEALIISLCAIMAFVIGISRLYLNVHWFTDVLGGLFLGGAIVLLSLSLHKSSISLLNKKNT